MYELSNDKHEKGTEYESIDEQRDDSFLSISEGREIKKFKPSQGRCRILEPCVLARFPDIDRQENRFPI